MRAFVYCRVSTEEQARHDHYSLGNQETRCRDYIKHTSWQVVKVFREVGSGKSAEREGYQELLGAIRGGKVEVVVVYRLDRLSRSVIDVYSALELFGQQDVAFVSVQESFDTTTAMGRAMLGVAAVFAQLTREMIAENVKDGLLRRAQAGKYLGSPHTRPYGYRYVDGGLEVVAEEAEVVGRIFRLYAEQGWGPQRIARLLNAEGVLTATGLVGRWGANAVGRILRNPVYAGRVRHGTQEFAGIHVPIVPEALYEAAQALLRERAALPPRAKSSPYLLSGLLKCGRCGRNLVTHRTVAKPERKAFLSYRHRDSATLPKCRPFQRSAAAVDSLVVAEVRKLAGSPAVREAALSQAREELGARRGPLAAECDEALSQLAEGDATFDRWAERLMRGSIDEEQFERLNRAHLTARRELRERLEGIETALAQAGDAELTLAEVEAMLAEFAATWEALSGDERRELLRSVVEDLRITPEALTVKLLFLPEVVVPLAGGRGRRKPAAG